MSTTLNGVLLLFGIVSSYAFTIEHSLGDNIFNASANYEVQRYRERVKILHDMIITEGCSPAKQQRRDTLTNAHGLELDVEIRLFHKLTEALIRCREGKLQTTTPRSNSQPTLVTATPTSTRSSVTTQPATAYSASILISSVTSQQLCREAVNLTEIWRTDHNAGYIRPDNEKGHWCDTRRMVASGRPWFRFSESAGNRLLNKCVPFGSCGTAAALWSDDRMPSQLAVITPINAYMEFNKNCRHKSLKASVLKCSSVPNDYIYRYDDWMEACSYAFCGMFGRYE